MWITRTQLVLFKIGGPSELENDINIFGVGASIEKSSCALGCSHNKRSHWWQGYSPYQILKCICGFHVLVY
jgi:hypothetical protein